MDSLVAVRDLPLTCHRLLRSIAKKMQYYWWSAPEITDELAQVALPAEVLSDLVAGGWLEADPDYADWFTVTRKTHVCLANDDQQCCFMQASTAMPLAYLGFSAELYRRDLTVWVIRVQLDDADWIRQRLVSGMYYRGETTL